MWLMLMVAAQLRSDDCQPRPAHCQPRPPHCHCRIDMVGLIDDVVLPVISILTVIIAIAMFASPWYRTKNHFLNTHTHMH
jgi:hypothetical protein